ncbi:MAG TPA: asparagine synthetase B, partial [Saprospiraceae bacterium]|nr:asparagine synthetase B [Saprospiraceae bacterium]
MLKRRLILLVLMAMLGVQAQAAYILLPMDAKGQRNHLKAYGITYWVLQNGVEAWWLLNYRGGSFAFAHSKALEKECITRGVSYEVIPDAQFALIRNQIADQ